jgi:hypothetical protein
MTDEPIDTWQADPSTLAFDYTNWCGDRYRYVVDFKAGHAPGPTRYEGDPALAGQLITRDGDTRPDMLTRRRTFVIDRMENVEVIS